jgi:hypothetical protein
MDKNISSPQAPENLVVASHWVYQPQTNNVLCNVDYYFGGKQAAAQIRYHKQKINTQLAARSLEILHLPEFKLSETHLKLSVKVVGANETLKTKVAVSATPEGTTCFNVTNKEGVVTRLEDLLSEEVGKTIVFELTGDQGFEWQLFFANQPGFAKGTLFMETESLLGS